MPLPPGPRTPAIVSLVDWMLGPVANFEKLFARYGDIYSLNMPIVGTEVVVNHPDLIKEVLTGSPDVFLGGEANRSIAPIVGDRSVLLLDGRPHARERKLLMPPFHGDRMIAYADVIRAVTERVVADFPRGKKFSLLPSMQRLTLEVMIHGVFGVHDQEEVAGIRTVLAEVLERVQSPLGMLWLHPSLQRNLGPLTGWAGIQRSLAEADRVLYALIARARSSESGARGGDILSMLLAAKDEEGQAMTDAELRDELITLLFAGHETTATALCWAIEEIVRRPEVHAHITSEIVSSSARTYLDAAIKEVLRLRPLTPFVVRKLAEPVELGGYAIPMGTLVVPCVYLAQRHPAYWEAASEFRVERFLDKKPDPYAWFPFGGGARRCIGMAFALYEMRIVLKILLSAVPLRLPDPPAKVSLRSFLFAPSRGPRVLVDTKSAEATA